MPALAPFNSAAHAFAWLKQRGFVHRPRTDLRAGQIVFLVPYIDLPTVEGYREVVDAKLTLLLAGHGVRWTRISGAGRITDEYGGGIDPALAPRA